MKTEEVSDRFVAPCLVNGLEAYDGEINLGVEENISQTSEEGLTPFICKMGKSSRNKKRAMKNLNFFYQDIGTSSSAGGHLTQEEAAKEELAIKMSQKFALLEEERPIIETMAYHDKYKKILDEVWKDKVELDGKIVKEEEEAVKRIKGEALKEKDDPGAFIFHIRLEGHVNKNALADTGSDINTMPFRIYVQLGREDTKKVDRGITMINHTQAEALGILYKWSLSNWVTPLMLRLLILDISIDHDSPIVVGQGFLRTIGGIVNTPERLFSTFDGFCHQTFHAARSDVLRNAESDSDDEEDYKIKSNKFRAPIYGPKPAPYLKLWEHTTMRPDHHDPNALDNLKPWKRYCFHKFTMSSFYGKDVTEMQSLAGSDEEIFTLVAWIRAFNINEPIYVELCHEFYSTYEFDEVCADDELQTKKIIKFRLGGRAHSLTLLEFALSREENLGLSRSHTSTIKKPILRVIHKMITYGLCQRRTGYDKIQTNDLWLLSMFDARYQNRYANVAWVIARWMVRKGAGTQKEIQICCGQFISKIARKCMILTEDVVRNLSAPIYCRDLDTITLRDLINSDGKLIPEDPQPVYQELVFLDLREHTSQDLYDKMEIRQEAIERMEYRQSYHWDMY
ncbi:hypothetical protein Tco_0720009 [Tanacetum coccineum]